MPNDTIKKLNINELENNYTKKIKEEATYHRFSLTILIDKINTEHMFNPLPEDFYYTYNVTSIASLKNELLSKELIKEKSVSDLLINKNITDIKHILEKNHLTNIGEKQELINRILNNLSRNEIYQKYKKEYIVTSAGLSFFKSNQQALFYDFILKNSIVDNIISYDLLYHEHYLNFSKEEIVIMLINNYSNMFLEKGDIISYQNTFDIEEKIYLSLNDTKNIAITLLKKFIYNLNSEYVDIYQRDALNPKVIRYLT